MKSGMIWIKRVELKFFNRKNKMNSINFKSHQRTLNFNGVFSLATTNTVLLLKNCDFKNEL